MVVQETWAKNMKMNNMKDTVKLHLNKIDSIKSKSSEGIAEENVIISLLAKKLSLKVTKAVILSIDTYKRDMIAVGNYNRKIKTKKNGIVSIICPCNNCWGLIIVFPYYVWLKVLFGLKKQKNLLMSFQLDIRLTQY